MIKKFLRFLPCWGRADSFWERGRLCPA